MAVRGKYYNVDFRGSSVTTVGEEDSVIRIAFVRRRSRGPAEPRLLLGRPKRTFAMGAQTRAGTALDAFAQAGTAFPSVPAGHRHPPELRSLLPPCGAKSRQSAVAGRVGNLGQSLV